MRCLTLSPSAFRPLYRRMSLTLCLPFSGETCFVFSSTECFVGLPLRLSLRRETRCFFSSAMGLFGVALRLLFSGETCLVFSSTECFVGLPLRL